MSAASHLAGSYRDAGRMEKATDLRRLIFETRRRILGPNHPSTAVAMAFLGEQLLLAGDDAEYERYLGLASTALLNLCGEERWFTRTCFESRARVRNNLGRYGSADEAARTAVGMRQRSIAQRKIERAGTAASNENYTMPMGTTLVELARALAGQQRSDEARQVLQEARPHLLHRETSRRREPIR